MKLWQKNGVAVSDKILEFTVGKDREFDLLLARHDVTGSLAHAAMLKKVGLLSEKEFLLIETELNNILKTIDANDFTIDETCEDIHSQIEAMLTARIGDAGKKIHTGRSRNDQVALDIKLYLRLEIHQIKKLAQQLFDQLIQLSEQHKEVLLPGYTHLQVAMPSSFGLWFGAYAESLVDDMEMMAAAYNVVNKNPLGSGAGYGSSFPLDRDVTTQLLDFGNLNHNSVYAQMSRGKSEKLLSMAISSIAATLSRFSMDVCLYMNQNFGFISFPDHLTTGSSIMPHKKNPDVFELIRGKCNRIQAVPNELTLLISNLPSGYHRELQLTKEILFPAIEDLKACLDIIVVMLSEIKIRSGILNDEKYKYLFTVEKINQLVNEGIPFRDAYQQVGADVVSDMFAFDGALNHTHQGSIGNLCNDQITAMMQATMKKIA
jgi:argininosuccinate lyase